MRVIIEAKHYQHEVDLVRFSPDATLADVILATTQIHVDRGEYWYCDEYRCLPSDKISALDLVEGMVISNTPKTAPTPIDDWMLLVSAGLDAGAMYTLPHAGTLLVGRAKECDVRANSLLISKHHFQISRMKDGVFVADCGSANGTYINGVHVGTQGVLVTDDAVITAGGIAFTLRRGLQEQAAARPGSLHNLTANATAPFNRPPRPGFPAPEKPAIPPEHKKTSTPNHFNIAAVAGPLLMAAVMVMAMHSWQYAIFAALSPIIAVGMWIEQRIRHSKEDKKERARYAQALQEFKNALRRQATHERLRRLNQLPDPAVCIRYCNLPDTRLWQCRPYNPDFLTLNAGIGQAPWEPRVERTSKTNDDVTSIIENSRIPQSPVEVDLNQAGVVGIVGDREAALAIARSLVLQASTHCGPADLTCVVCCDQGRERAWRWTTWLPHTRMAGNTEADRWTSCDANRSDAMLHALRDSIDAQPTPAMLLVIDSDTLLEGRDAPARDLLGHGRVNVSAAQRGRQVLVSGIVIATSEERLPAACNTIINAQADAEGTIRYPESRQQIRHAILAGISTDTALVAARLLAHFDDPEMPSTGAALPALVRLPDILDLDAIDAASIRNLWRRQHGIGTPIGIGSSGVMRLDLVKDGPHGLVGGTTGSGKSEFLRSLVAGLAANVPPSKLTFILADFKGGAAFQACERLPHTIGTISNLDAQSADRAIRALEAEMEYRQRLFAQAGRDVDNLDSYMATNPPVPLPRLLFIVDEFAMLAKEYPDVLSSLVSIAAVGRTLGVHMILATQRPDGVVNDDILANTNLRVSLRVQSSADSTNVIEVPDAATISRDQRGRAYVKLGRHDITLIQTALVTGSVRTVEKASVDLRPVVFGQAPAPVRPTRLGTAVANHTDLDDLIDAIVEANRQERLPAPRPVWPAPLPEHISLAGFQSDKTTGTMPAEGRINGAKVIVAVSDDPDHQRQIPVGWDMAAGNIIMAGIPGSGTDAALASIGLTLCRSNRPEDLDLLIMDMGSGSLRPLAKLPHAIGYAGSGSQNKEKRSRLFTYLGTEIDRRKNVGKQGNKPLVVLIDGLAALKDEYQDFHGLELLEKLYQAWASGPEYGIWFAASTTRPRMLPSAIADVTTQRWMFQLADQYDYSTVGIKPAERPAELPGRFVPISTKLQTQIATPDCPLPQAVDLLTAMFPSAAAKPSIVKELPIIVYASQMPTALRFDAEPWLIPIGLAERNLKPVTLQLYENEHALIAGPARCGKSSLLLAIAEEAKQAGLMTYGICTRRSPLVDSPNIDACASSHDERVSLMTAMRMDENTPCLLLIDDAERIDDTDKAIANLIAGNNSQLHIIAAGRADDLRTQYSHWSKSIRKSHSGLLLQPNPDYDGELLSVKIPRTATVPIGCGRGYLCNGSSPLLVQSISPTPAHASPIVNADSPIPSSKPDPITLDSPSPADSGVVPTVPIPVPLPGPVHNVQSQASPIPPLPPQQPARPPLPIGLVPPPPHTKPGQDGAPKPQCPPLPPKQHH